MKRTILPCLLCLAFAFVSSVLGDTLLLKDGRTFHGRLVKRTDKVVVFEVQMAAGSVTLSFATENVLKVVEEPVSPPTQPTTHVVHNKAAKSGPTYFVIPIHGEFGTNVTSKIYSRCLNLAESSGATFVILEIDSGGGNVKTLLAMLKAAQKHKKLVLVAYVKKAASAAAILAMSCRKIVIAPTGVIGASVVYIPSPTGTPQNIQEKFESFCRAQFRAAAENAGHNPLLVEGMMRTDIVLGLVKNKGKVEIVEGKGSEILKPKGKILTLTGQEAVKCGLCLGVANSTKNCNTVLGIATWKEHPNRTGRALFARWNIDLKNAGARFERIMKNARKLYDEALVNDPTRFTYTVDRFGNFSPKSLKQWRDRSKKCLDLLEKLEKRLAQAGGITRRFPQLGLSTSWIDKFKQNVSVMRQQIEADKKRRGIAPR